MTTAIAILNREAIALAADSAVTVAAGEPAPIQKIYSSANKIFGLSRTEPVGLIVYNAGSFLGIPWETAIKLYRAQLAATSFESVDGYLVDFLAYLTRGSQFASSATEMAWREALVRQLLSELERDLRSRVGEQLRLRLEAQDATPLGEAEITAILSHLVEARLVQVRAGPAFEGSEAVDLEAISGATRESVRRIGPEVFGDLPLVDSAVEFLVELAVDYLLRARSGSFSGVAVAGFGSGQLLPALSEAFVDGVLDGRLRWWWGRKQDVAASNAGIVLFAQDDMGRAFIEGVSPKYELAIEELLRNVIQGYPTVLMDGIEGFPSEARQLIESRHPTIGQDVLTQALGALAQWRKQAFIDELMTIVQGLPKEELAAFAEALVNLTSLRRRLSREAETVGGPVDVAVISKGDGLIWLRRKHYFDPSMNPQYMTNRYGRMS
jgi:hypothetical protein